MEILLAWPAPLLLGFKGLLLTQRRMPAKISRVKRFLQKPLEITN